MVGVCVCFASSMRHTRCALVTGVQTCALPISLSEGQTGRPDPYRRTELVEPDWTRFPGWEDVTVEEWESVQWQRAHCVKNLKQLRELFGDLVDERFYADLERDQAERATMSMLVPPQLMNTRVPYVEPAGPG